MTASQDLLFVPLGGAGEIGMNLNLYAYGDKWLMVDLGVTFADDYFPGVDLILPKTTFIEDRRKDLLGIVLTHAHEDHAGAVAHLWPRLKCPVYATPFTAAFLRTRLKEMGLLEVVPVHEVPLGGRVKLDPFTVDYISITHSIAEPNSLLISTPAGRIFHTGDWKLDPEPLVGKPTDEAALQAIGDNGVLAMVCDSTNVFNAEASGSEGAVRQSLMTLLADRPQRVVVTTFASNIARVATLAAVAAAHGRELCLIGRALERNVEIARALGYLRDLPPLVSAEDLGYLPPERVMIVCTGCQGEGRAALARIATGQHRDIALDPGDLVVFSSKMIPGNEVPIGMVINQLIKEGIEVITEKDAFVHVSGHPGRAELERLYRLIRPQIAVPVHGEIRHMARQGWLARELGVPQVVGVENGDIVRLAPGPAEIIEYAESGRLALDGRVLVEADGDAIVGRRRISYNGYLGIAVALDEDGELAADPSLDLQGLPDADGKLADRLAEVIEAAYEKLKPAERRDDAKVAEHLRVAARRAAKEATGKETGPITKVHVLRV